MSGIALTVILIAALLGVATMIVVVLIGRAPLVGEDEYPDDLVLDQPATDSSRDEIPQPHSQATRPIAYYPAPRPSSRATSPVRLPR